MAIARRLEDLDTHTYWMDVKDALTQVCGLSPDEAANEVGEMRLAMSCLSEWGQLLSYHEGVPQAAEDIWLRRCGGEDAQQETAEIQRNLIGWYADRNRQRGLPHVG